MIRAVCIEIGGGSIQTAVFSDAPDPAFGDVPTESAEAPLLIAVPGLIDGSRVAAASNLGWYDVDPVEKMGLRGPALVVCNDAEAAAVGEATLRDVSDLTYMGLGTGIGGVIVRDGVVVEREVFGHRGRFGVAPCSCGRSGCLETVAAGWALPDPLPKDRIPGIADALSRALLQTDAPSPVVVAGGLATRYPEIVDEIRQRTPGVSVEASAAPATAKSAAPWGLLRIAGIALNGRPAAAR